MCGDDHGRRGLRRQGGKGQVRGRESILLTICSFGEIVISRAKATFLCSVADWGLTCSTTVEPAVERGAVRTDMRHGRPVVPAEQTERTSSTAL